VKNLQARLIAHGYGISAGPTGNYGAQTDAAVRACQAAHVPPADPAGRSYVGSKQANHLFAYAGSPYRIYP
jgi:peptidoglycan hydrolase-like protein with peptidoglycan-binding domain